MNDIFFAVISGVNVVVGVLMFIILMSSTTKKWNGLSKLGFAIMALGLIGQAIYVISRSNLSDPIFDQLWMLKDIGMAIFVVPLVSHWCENLTSND